MGKFEWEPRYRHAGGKRDPLYRDIARSKGVQGELRTQARVRGKVGAAYLDHAAKERTGQSQVKYRRLNSVDWMVYLEDRWANVIDMGDQGRSKGLNVLKRVRGGR